MKENKNDHHVDRARKRPRTRLTGLISLTYLGPKVQPWNVLNICQLFGRINESEREQQNLRRHDVCLGWLTCTIVHRVKKMKQPRGGWLDWRTLTGHCVSLSLGGRQAAHTPATPQLPAVPLKWINPIPVSFSLFPRKPPPHSFPPHE